MSLTKIKVNNSDIIGVDEYPTRNSNNLQISKGVANYEWLGESGDRKALFSYEGVMFSYFGELRYDGEWIQHESSRDFRSTAFIRVFANENILFTGGYMNNTNCFVFGYDIDKSNPIRLLDAPHGGVFTDYKITIPDGVSYVRAFS